MIRRLTIVLAGVSAALSACARSEPKPAAPPSDAASAAPVTVTLADYTIAAPATMPASMATFTVNNTGKEVHQAALVRLDSGKTLADFQEAMKVQGPPPRWITWIGGTHAWPGGSSQVSIPLVAGTYVWYCIIPGPDGVPHFAKGMSAAMTVTAGDTTQVTSRIAADIDVTMHDYTWDLSTPLTVGMHTLKVTTAPGQPHELVLVRLVEGKTAKDFATWTEKMQGPPPVESLNGIAVLQPGQVNYTTIDFKPGHYAFVCFVPDSADGKPHVAHGMVKEFTIQ